MQRLFYIPVLLICLLSCKNDKPEPEEVIRPLVGMWLLTERTQTINGKIVWKSDTAAAPVYLTFGTGGEILNADGKVICCGPSELIINGTPFQIKPQTKNTYNPLCEVVNCYGCPTLTVEHSANELIMTSCFDFKTKYVKI